MAKKCNICGREKNVIIKCPECHRWVCLNDFWVKMGLCADCITEEYNKKYSAKIDQYCENEENITNNGLSVGG